MALCFHYVGKIWTKYIKDPSKQATKIEKGIIEIEDRLRRRRQISRSFFEVTWTVYAIDYQGASRD